MIQYDDDQVAGFCSDCEAAFTKVGQPWNARAGVWPARMQFDAVTMGYEAARAKQLRALYVALGLTPPFEPAPRYWAANMCGIRVSGLPAVPGGASDPSLFLSWFYDRYDAPTRAIIRQAMKGAGCTHWLLSWPDSRAAGYSSLGFVATCAELVADGFYPCPMLYSKDYDPSDFADIMANIQPVLPLLIGLAPAVCIGWELSIALSPTTVQQLIDAIAPQFTPSSTPVYVHFQPGYFAFQQPGQPTAAFWIANVGKLTGVLRQRNPEEDNGDKSAYQSRVKDCLDRFAGGFGFPKDSGFGHPFDDVELEITASQQFNGSMTEADGNLWGDAAIATPPSGAVKVMGSGNGATNGS